MILALSSTGDITTDYVIRALTARSKDVVRVNTDALLVDWSLICDPLGICATSGDHSFRARDITSVYYRRARRPTPHPETHPESSIFAWREAHVALRGLYSQLDCPWISHYLAVIAAENRIHQMYLAERLGFPVPAWIVTNESSRAKDFFNRYERVVFKALSYGALGHGTAVHTSPVQQWNATHDAEVQICPTLLQVFVNKRYEYRVTVVDDQVFACRIDSQSNAKYAVDMRRGLMDSAMEHVACEIADDIKQFCIRIVSSLGLRFGAIDLVEDRNSRFWFLEINPTGQWAWVEDRTALPIAGALADALAK